MATTSPSPGYGGLFLNIGGALSGAIGSFYSAKVAKINLEGQAFLADTNARIAELGAQSVLNQGQQEIGRLTMQAGKVKSAQRVALAANGVDLGEGNAAELQASTDIMKEIDRNTVEANAVRSAWGYRTQAVNSQNDAMVKRSTADTISPFGTAATSLLGSAGNVATSWYQLNKATANSPSNG